MLISNHKVELMNQLHSSTKAKIRNVKVITSEECVPKHKLLVMDMAI